VASTDFWFTRCLIFASLACSLIAFFLAPSAYYEWNSPIDLDATASSEDVSGPNYDNSSGQLLSSNISSSNSSQTNDMDDGGSEKTSSNNTQNGKNELNNGSSSDNSTGGDNESGNGTSDSNDSGSESLTLADSSDSSDDPENGQQAENERQSEKDGDDDSSTNPQSSEEEDRGSGDSTSEESELSSSLVQESLSAKPTSDSEKNQSRLSQTYAERGLSSVNQLPTTVVVWLFMVFVSLSLLGGMTTGVFISEGIRTTLLMSILGPLLAARHGKEHDIQTRGRIQGYVEAHPGIFFSALRDALNLANGVTAHHLHQLEKSGAIISWQDGRRRRYAVSGIDSTKLHEIEHPLSGMQRAILEILFEVGEIGITSSEIQIKLDASRQLMRYHLKQLMEKKLADSKGRGRKITWFLSQYGLKQLPTIRKTPDI